MTIRRYAPLTALLLSAGLALGQGAPKKDVPTPKPAPGSLEDTLEKALRNSADIKAAEAKVRTAEADLNRVRHQVLTKATILHSDLNVARRMLDVAEATVKEAERLVQIGAVNREGIPAVRAVAEKHRGEIEKLEAELKALRGEFALKGVLGVAFDPDGRRFAGMAADGTVRVWDTITGQVVLDPASAAQPKVSLAVPGSMAERVRKLLDQEVTFKASNVPLETALRELLAEAKSDIPVRALLQQDQAETRPGLPPGKLPVGAWIQALEDSDPVVVVVVRDYGLLLTMRDRIPDGALRVQDLWKGNYAQSKKDEPKGAEKK